MVIKPAVPLVEKILLGILLVLLAAVFNYSHLTQRLDNFIYDTHLTHWPRAKSDDIVLVVIDDQSIGEIGRWPWPRRFHAKLLEELRDAKAVGLDIFFSEPDSSDPEGDQMLANAIANHGRVVLPVAPVIHSRGDSNELHELSSLPMFASVAAGQGHVDVELDEDSISRSVFLTAGLNFPNRKALPVVVMELDDKVLLGGERNNKISFEGNTWVRDHRVLLPFSGEPDQFQKISFSDVINQKIDPASFKDKWVMVGMDATGLGDRMPTPMTRSNQPMSGVEFEAHILDILQHKDTIRPLSDHINILLTIPFIILLLILVNLFRSERSWIAMTIPLVATLVFCFAISRFGFSGEHLWFRPGPAIVALLIGSILLHRRQLTAFISSLTQEKENAEIAMNTVSDAIIITDKAGRVEFMNPNAEELTGYLLKNSQGKLLAEILTVEGAEGEPYPIDLVVKSEAINSKVELPEDHFLKLRDDNRVPLWASAKPFIDDEEDITGVIIAFNERKGSDPHTEINVLDELTQLPAMPLLYDRLQHALFNANRTKRLVSVLYIDLIDFSKINDALGTEYGDAVLREVGRRLTSRRRTGDTVARVGDDEFIMVLENLEETGPVASVATSLLDLIKEPYELVEHEVFVEASIGISTFPKDGLEVETLKNNAYTAMKRAKKSLREDIPRFRFYSDEINRSALQRLLSEKDLRNALTHEKFELYYQPRIDFKTGRIVAVEALIRWRRSGDELIMPTSFIPLAERSGLITEIGSWVLRTASKQAKDWENEGLNLPRMSINLSPRQFMQHDLLGTITSILDDADLEPCHLELEITENSLVKDTDRCIEIIKEFRRLGGTVSIDDFGTGYSSLSYLKNFPVDILKIDKVFIQDITTEPDHAAITLAVISMAHSLNLQVVAEGVEQESEFNFLRSKGCDELQGYFFSKPLPAAEMTKMLKEKHCLKIDEIKDNATTTLLLIDDDSETLNSISIMLRDEGYRILMAENGNEALSLLTRHAVGVVVSDEVMPGIKGSQLLKKIKLMYPDSVRILMSANADRDAIITAINSGAIFKFLNKPISESDLKSSLKEAFIKYKSSRTPVEELMV